VALPAPSEGSAALVTGASSGIGVELARALARRGHGLILVARREERLSELARELAEEHDIQAAATACDLADAQQRERLAAEVSEQGLEVELLVNNAGFGYAGDFVAARSGSQVEMVRLNVEAVVDLTERYLPGMTERGRGAIINLASTAAFQPLPRNATYAATKAFVLNFSEALHNELKGTGVTVTAVCPGPVRTEFADVAGIGDAEDRTPGLMWMSPEDVAEEAVSAAEKGKRAIVPGVFNLAGSVLGRHAPRTISLPLAKRAWQYFD
jgi:short-subunit dehydrogenase